MTRTDIARRAVSMALRVRQRAGLGLSAPANPFDACAALNIEVRFANIPSMEGMLARRPRLTIIVSAVRPPGRQAFTCAHELGHLVLDHQSTVDDVIDLMTEGEPGYRQDDLDEYAADQFAAFFLMPKTAVMAALRDWNIDPERCAAADIFHLASCVRYRLRSTQTIADYAGVDRNTALRGLMLLAENGLVKVVPHEPILDPWGPFWLRAQ